MRTTNSILASSAILQCVSAQYPAIPSDVSIVKSKIHEEVTISFKQVCEQSPGVKVYSGFVHLPGHLLEEVGGFDVNTYFLYFEARSNASTAPLSIYLAGGPGESSTYAALSSENGPCYVNAEGTDTINNPWSFNDYSNLLYIDQPLLAGFSYSELINGTFDLLTADGVITPLEANVTSLPAANASFGYGTYPDQSFDKTANNTVQASKLLWHFAEHWLSSFPGYVTHSNKVNIIGNSYGGYFVPETAIQITENLQNLTLDHPLKCKELKIDSIGITNGCVDIQSAMLGYPDFAHNNTYDVQFASEAEYASAVDNYTMPGGCRDLIEECRLLGQESDPAYVGNNATVNELCMQAFGFCYQYVIGGFPSMNEHLAFDVAQYYPAPCDFYLPVMWFLNNATTQKALGVPLNFTWDSNVVTQNFGLPSAYSGLFPLNASSGDAVRQNGLPNIESLLAHGVKVAFIFGDRDYRCPWTGGEATALAAEWPGQADFVKAGYQEMQGIETPIEKGGLRALVKQHGSFSFSRIMDAGHTVSAYAPETVYRIWERTIRGVDVVTGNNHVDTSYSTTGPDKSWAWRNHLPAKPPQTCIVEGQFTDANPWDAVTGNGA